MTGQIRSLIRTCGVTTSAVYCGARKALMRLRLTTLLLLASVTIAEAQRHAPATGGTPAAQMAARAKANAGTNRILDAASGGMASLYPSPDSAPADLSASADRIIRSQVTGTPGDQLIHYPYGRYGATLGNVDPNSLYNR